MVGRVFGKSASFGCAKYTNYQLSIINMTSISQPTQKLAHKFNTAQILRGGWYTTWGASLLLLVVSISGVHTQRNAIKTVGKDAAPSVLMAQRLKDSFADMDASLANELLMKPGENSEALKGFEISRKKIAERLVIVAKNITFPGEEKLIQSLQLNTSAYLLKLQEARDAHKRGDLVSRLNIYRDAANLMDNQIIRQAEELSQLNSLELDKIYAQQRFENGGVSFLIAVIGIALIAVLAMIQIFLYQRMRRILNLPLLGATAIAIIFLGYTLSSFLGAANNLRIAKEDAFNSLHALRQMRSMSYQANADESRYLLDKDNAKNHEQSFKNKIAKIITIPAGRSIEGIVNNTKQGKKTLSITGLLANSLNNITFDGEGQLAIDTLNTFNNYLSIDIEIRRLYNSGKVAEAIALCIGNKDGQSNWAFERYKSAQTHLIDLNQKEFDGNIQSGNDRLDNFELIATVTLLTIAILTLFGLRPRLMEYL